MELPEPDKVFPATVIVQLIGAPDLEERLPVNFACFPPERLTVEMSALKRVMYRQLVTLAGQHPMAIMSELRLSIALGVQSPSQAAEFSHLPISPSKVQSTSHPPS